MEGCDTMRGLIGNCTLYKKYCMGPMCSASQDYEACPRRTSEELYTKELDEAYRIAVLVHGNQKDLAGKPYLSHVLTVFRSVELESDKIVALLHDTLEEGADIEVLDWFSLEVKNAVESITRRQGEAYRDYIVRVGKNEVATRVKIADLRHNLDLSRMPNPAEHDIDRAIKYLKAWRTLLSIQKESGMASAAEAMK